MAEHFEAWHGEENNHTLEYEVIKPIRLPRLDSREDLDALGEKFQLESLMNGGGAEEMAYDMQSSVLPGWIIPNNYPDGDDIMLVSGDFIQPVDKEPVEEGKDRHGLPGTWSKDEQGNSVYHMTPEEIAERERVRKT